MRNRSPSTVNTKEAAHMHHASRAASRELIPPGPRFGLLLLAAPGVMVVPLFVSPSLKTNGDTLCDPMHPRMISSTLFSSTEWTLQNSTVQARTRGHANGSNASQLHLSGYFTAPP